MKEAFNNSFASGGPPSPRQKVAPADGGVLHRPKKSVMGTLAGMLNTSMNIDDQKSGRHLLLDGGFSQKPSSVFKGK